MAVTTKDIARETGMSHSTVSRVLNGVEGHRVSEATQRRILEAAQRLEYQPNAIARSLKQGRTNIVGFYSGFSWLDVRKDFDGEIIGGLQEAAADYRLDLLLPSYHHGPVTEELFSKLSNGFMDGIFVFATPDNPFVERLASSSLHAVGISEAIPSLPCVTCDDADGIRQVLQHLWNQGHRRIGFVATEASLVSAKRRLTAFQSTLAEWGVAPEDARVFNGDHHSEPVLQAVQKLPVTSRPTAICCWNDGSAYNLLRQCLTSGIRVPDDLAIIGFDGFLDTKLPSRQLMTVHCPWREVSATAMQLLVQLMQGETVKPETCLPVQLLAGDTA